MCLFQDDHALGPQVLEKLLLRTLLRTCYIITHKSLVRHSIFKLNQSSSMTSPGIKKDSIDCIAKQQYSLPWHGTALKLMVFMLF